MMLEIIDGALQENPHFINGISQTPANGFDKYWADWDDINAMVKIVKKHMSKNISQITLTRTHSISGLKSRVLKLNLNHGEKLKLGLEI